MKIVTKLALATLAISSILSAGALADGIRIVERYNNHGVGRLIYQQCDPSASAAVYAQGQSVGSNAASASTSPRLTLHDNGHGVTRFAYTAE